MSERLMGVGDAARALNVSTQLVRVLEGKGILSGIRTEGGVRIFRADDVERLRVERELARQAKTAAASAANP